MHRYRKFQIFTIMLAIFFFAIYGTRITLGQGEGQILGDSGFRPKPNGFAFQNYTNETVKDNMTAVEMQRMFGDAVCADKNTPCTLVPPAQALMDEVNKAMNGGHCFGMAGLSLSLYYGKEPVDPLGAPTTPDMKLATSEVQRTIAYYMGTQFMRPTSDKFIADKTPSEVVDLLAASMKDGKNTKEAYVVGFRKRDLSGGHAVAPYSVTDQGNNIAWINIYDNNFPGEERHIEVDRAANTWKYSAAASPDIPESLYDGDATTKTLVLIPLSAQLEKQQCDFCSGGGQTTTGSLGSAAATPVATEVANPNVDAKFNRIFLSSTDKINKANLLISDAAGHKIGFEGAKFVNDFPGARYTPVFSDDLWKDNPEPIYYIPVGVAFTVTLDGSQLTSNEGTDVVMIGPGYDLAVEGIVLEPKLQDTITFSPDGSEINYKSSNTEAPNMVVGFDGDPADYEFEIKGAEIEENSTINIKLDQAKSTLSVKNSNAKTASVFDLVAHKYTESGEKDVTKANTNVDAGKGILIDYGKMTDTDIPIQNQ